MKLPIRYSLAALPPLVAAGIMLGGLAFFTRLASLNGIFYLESSDKISKSGALGHVGTVINIFLFTDLLCCILGLACVWVIVSFRAPHRRICLLGSACLAAIMIAVEVADWRPLWSSVSKELFSQTVLDTVAVACRCSTGGAYLTFAIAISNLFFISASALLTFSALGIYFQSTEDQNELKGSGFICDCPTPASINRPALTLEFVSRSQQMLFIAAAIMVLGLTNTVSWMFWPLGYFDPGGPPRLAAEYREIAKATIVFLGTSYSLIITMIFIPHFCWIRRELSQAGAASEALWRSRAVSTTWGVLKFALTALAPLGASIFAVVVGAPGK